MQAIAAALNERLPSPDSAIGLIASVTDHPFFSLKWAIIDVAVISLLAYTFV